MAPAHTPLTEINRPAQRTAIGLPLHLVAPVEHEELVAMANQTKSDRPSQLLAQAFGSIKGQSDSRR